VREVRTTLVKLFNAKQLVRGRADIFLYTTRLHQIIQILLSTISPPFYCLFFSSFINHLKPSLQPADCNNYKMNFRTCRQFGDKIMKDGDLVIVYERHDTLDHIYLKKGETFKNKYGTFPHDDIIGMKPLQKH